MMHGSTCVAYLYTALVHATCIQSLRFCAVLNHARAHGDSRLASIALLWYLGIRNVATECSTETSLEPVTVREPAEPWLSWNMESLLTITSVCIC
jgi:hypothetical protein